MGLQTVVGSMSVIFVCRWCGHSFGMHTDGHMLAACSIPECSCDSYSTIAYAPPTA